MKINIKIEKQLIFQLIIIIFRKLKNYMQKVH